MLYRKYIKGVVDRLVAVIAFLLLSPVFLVLVILLAFANRGKPFFRQVRPGRQERLFRVLKFKTMNDRRDASGQLLPDVERLTPIGRFVRAASLDELPQLLNVVAGDMSLVGPRPLLPDYLPLYDARQRRRHEVKPGITGWAQVNGRNAIGWEQKFNYDVWYVDNLTPALDLKIIAMTVRKVFKREGISSATAATMERFTGLKQEQL